VHGREKDDFSHECQNFVYDTIKMLMQNSREIFIGLGDRVELI